MYALCWQFLRGAVPTDCDMTIKGKHVVYKGYVYTHYPLNAKGRGCGHSQHMHIKEMCQAWYGDSKIKLHNLEALIQIFCRHTCI